MHHLDDPRPHVQWERTDTLSTVRSLCGNGTLQGVADVWQYLHDAVTECNDSGLEARFWRDTCSWKANNNCRDFGIEAGTHVVRRELQTERLKVRVRTKLRRELR